MVPTRATTPTPMPTFCHVFIASTSRFSVLNRQVYLPQDNYARRAQNVSRLRRTTANKDRRKQPCFRPLLVAPGFTAPHGPPTTKTRIILNRIFSERKTSKHDFGISRARPSCNVQFASRLSSGGSTCAFIPGASRQPIRHQGIPSQSRGQPGGNVSLTCTIGQVRISAQTEFRAKV